MYAPRCHELCVLLHPVKIVKFGLIVDIDEIPHLVATQEHDDPTEALSLLGGQLEPADRGCIFNALTREIREESGLEEFEFDYEALHKRACKLSGKHIKVVNLRYRTVVMAYWPDFDVSLCNALIHQQRDSDESTRREVVRLHALNTHTGLTHRGHRFPLGRVVRAILGVCRSMRTTDRD